MRATAFLILSGAIMGSGAGPEPGRLKRGDHLQLRKLSWQSI